MGWIARSQLASAVCNAGGLGIIETSSGELDAIKDEIRAMREFTDKPFGVNIAQAFVRDPSIAQFVVDQGVTFVTTSAGDPNKYTRVLKDNGLTVFHVVPTLAAALKAVDAGVDGLVVEGVEGGGFKDPKGASTMVLLPLVRSHVDIPIIAAGGICDGVSMAAAFALGAEGVQMGTRMMSAAESPIHHNWKAAVVATVRPTPCCSTGSPSRGYVRCAAHVPRRWNDGTWCHCWKPETRWTFTSEATWKPLCRLAARLPGALAASNRSRTSSTPPWTSSPR